MYRTQFFWCLIRLVRWFLVFGRMLMTLIVDLFGFLLMAGSIHLTLAVFLAVPLVPCWGTRSFTFCRLHRATSWRTRRVQFDKRQVFPRMLIGSCTMWGHIEAINFQRTWEFHREVLNFLLACCPLRLIMFFFWKFELIFNILQM